MAEDSSSTHTRFHRHRRRLSSSTSGGKTDSSPENSLSSNCTDHEFNSPTTQVTVSVQFLTMLQEKIKAHEERINKSDEMVNVLKEKLERTDAEVIELKKQIRFLELRGTDELKKDVDEPKKINNQSALYHTCTDSTNDASAYEGTICDEAVTTKPDYTIVMIPCEPQTPTKSTNSAPFFSDKENTGYQMCIHLSRNEHIDPELTFALVIMRGKLDKILPWPFNRGIALTLVNIEDTSKHKIIMIQPNSEKSFQRPKSDLNEPFIFLQQRYTGLFNGGFISDDKVTLHVTVT